MLPFIILGPVSDQPTPWGLRKWVGYAVRFSSTLNARPATPDGFMTGWLATKGCFQTEVPYAEYVPPGRVFFIPDEVFQAIAAGENISMSVVLIYRNAPGEVCPGQPMGQAWSGKGPSKPTVPFFVNVATGAVASLAPSLSLSLPTSLAGALCAGSTLDLPLAFSLVPPVLQDPKAGIIPFQWGSFETMVLLNGVEAWRGQVREGSIPLSLPLGVSFDPTTVAVSAAARFLDPLSGSWVEGARATQSYFISPSFGDVSLQTLSVPSVVPAGEPGTIIASLRGTGCPVKVRASTPFASREESLGVGQVVDFPFSFAMTYDDLAFLLRVERLGKGQQWENAFEKVLTIPAAFPQASAFVRSASTSAVPGDSVEVVVEMVNTGSVGLTSLRAEGEQLTSSTLPFERHLPGETKAFQFRVQMPGVLEWEARFTPLWLGRGKQVVEGAPVGVVVRTKDAVLVEPKRVLFVGGEQQNALAGFLAGSGIRDSIAGAALPFLPYAFPLSPGQVVEISFSSLNDISVIAERSMAVSENGRVVARGARYWRLGALPLVVFSSLLPRPSFVLAKGG